MTSFKVVTVLLCCFAAVNCVPASSDQRSSRNVIQTEDDLLDSVYADCLKKDSISCAKYKLYNVVDKMLGQKDITIADGVELVSDESAPAQTQTARALKGDETVESLIFDKFATFFDTHNFKIELRGKDLVETARSTARSIGDAFAEEEETEDDAVEEGRGKKKKVKKILGPLMAIAGLKMAILGKIALAVIALIAGKALIIGKLALVLSAIIGLKKLFASGGSSVTHEVVAHPHHSTGHVVSHDTSYGGSAVGYSADVSGGYGSSSHGGWQRSLDAQQLAYRGQKEA
nr:uncharacterized protein LOC111427317 [Onthophagus taurus]